MHMEQCGQRGRDQRRRQQPQQRVPPTPNSQTGPGEAGPLRSRALPTAHNHKCVSHTHVLEGEPARQCPHSGACRPPLPYDGFEARTTSSMPNKWSTYPPPPYTSQRRNLSSPVCLLFWCVWLKGRQRLFCACRNAPLCLDCNLVPAHVWPRGLRTLPALYLPRSRRGLLRRVGAQILSRGSAPPCLQRSTVCV